MITYGLIGYPLTHSWSEAWFSEKFIKEHRTGIRYLNFPLLSVDLFHDLIHRQKDLMGLNVTLPYKERIIPYLDELDETAAGIGAVNTICIKREDHRILTKGYNTDAFGFLHSSDYSAHRHALILGTGGAAKAVAFVLDSLGVDWKFVSRTRNDEQTVTYKEVTASLLEYYTLIINATPVGTYPNIGSSPGIPYQALSAKHFLYDLVYNPEITVFQSEGIRKDAHIQKGLKMLHLQAQESLRIWDEAMMEL